MTATAAVIAHAKDATDAKVVVTVLALAITVAWTVAGRTAWAAVVVVALAVVAVARVQVHVIVAINVLAHVRAVAQVLAKAGALTAVTGAQQDVLDARRLAKAHVVDARDAQVVRVAAQTHALAGARVHVT